MIKFELKKATARSLALISILLFAVSILSGLLACHEEKPDGYGEIYASVLDDIIYDAKLNYRRIADKGSAPARFQENVIGLYGALTDNDVSAEVRGWGELLSMSAPFVSATAATAAVAFILASAEVRGDLLILSLKERRRGIACSKLLLVGAAAVGFNLLAAVSAAAGVYISVGFDGGGAPIASVEAYMRCPYDITAAGGVALRLLISISASLALGVMSMTAVIFLKRAVYAALAAIVAVSVDVTICSNNTDVLSLLYNFTFTGALSDSFLKRYSGIGFGGGVFLSRAVLTVTLLLTLTAVFSACFLFGVMSYSNVRASGKKRGRAESGRGHKLVYYEFRRACGARAVIPVAVLTALSVTLLVTGNRSRTSSWEAAYRQTVDDMAEMTFEGQSAYIEMKIADAREALAARESARDKHAAGEISGEEYSKLVKRASSAEFMLTVYESIEEKLRFIGEYRPDIDGALVYDFGWRALFARGVDFIPALAVLTVVLQYVFSERTTGYDRILSAALFKDERVKFFRRKLAVSLAVSSVVLILFFASELFFISWRYGFSSWTKPAVGIGMKPPLGALPIIVVVFMRYGAYWALTEALAAAAFAVNGAAKKQAAIGDFSGGRRI